MIDVTEMSLEEICLEIERIDTMNLVCLMSEEEIDFLGGYYSELLNERNLRS